MAEKIKHAGIIIAVIAGITLPTLAIAWAGGGRLARVEVVAEEAKETGEINTKEIKALTEDIHKNEILFIGLKSTAESTKDDTKELRADFKELKNYLMQYDFNKKDE
jgi:hypothetical protein